MRIISFLFFAFVAACSAPYELPNVTNTGGTSASGQLTGGSDALPGLGHVSMHADRTLRMNNSCTKIMKLNFGQTQDYRNVMQELKNRALLMGGNSVSLVEWFEDSNTTGYVGNIYICKDKTYHIHPHPG
jgi:hypothetical protein